MPVILDEKRIEAIQRKSQVTSIDEIAAYLQKTLGQKMTAYLSGLNSQKAVSNWIAKRTIPRDEAAIRLRHAYIAVQMIVDVYGADTAKAWLFGTNTRLNDEAPAYILRHSKTLDDLRGIVPAAKTFATPNE